MLEETQRSFNKMNIKEPVNLPHTTIFPDIEFFLFFHDNWENKINDVNFC